MAFAASLLAAPVAHAALEVRVDEGVSEPLPIAIPDFIGINPDASRMGADVANVVRADLERSGLFRPLAPTSFIENITDINVPPRFGDWRIIQAQGLVTGQATVQPDGRLRVDFRLWDIFGEEQMIGLQYTATPENWRRIAHLVSDAIYQRITGEAGYFDTRIVFIAESGPGLDRRKRLAVMDQDGANPVFLTQGDYLVLTPRFHPSRDEIAFMSFANNRPRVYLFNLSSGRQSVLGEFNGMTFAPRFAPDGGRVVMSVASANGSDIVSVDIGSRGSRQLTNSGAIDVSPCFSPDGSQICFASDRGGDQQIYVMDAGGGGARRISFGSGRYATPVWSPRGDLIAFTRYGGEGGNFSIGVMRPDGSGERILAESWQVEGPTFAPNGRVIMFWREGRARDARGSGFSSRLVSVDITGFNERNVDTPTDASDPAWSPLGT